MKFYNGDIIQHKGGNACIYLNGDVYWITTSTGTPQSFSPVLNLNKYWENEAALQAEGKTVESYREEWVKLTNISEVVADYLNEYNGEENA